MQGTPVVIRLVSDEEREQVLDFIRGVYYKHFRTLPSPPQIILAAWRGDEVIGTIALDCGDKCTQLPLEHLYSFDYEETPWPLESQTCVQYSRWTATAPKISVALMHAATVHALKMGKIYGLTEVKPNIEARAREIGIKLEPIPNARIVASKIASGDKPYYHALPRPRLCMVELVQKEKALRKAIGEFSRKGGTIIVKSAKALR